MSTRARISLFALLAFYFLVELFYISRLPLAPDEFHFLYQISELGFRAPYTEIQPYKTLLGQYYQSFVLLFTSDEWTAIFWIKIQMALSVVIVFAWGSFYLSRLFNPKSVLISLALLVSMSTFLERSSDLRVDMLTSLVGFVGLCLLLDRKLILAGFFAGLSFLISQKGIYFCIASVVSVFVVSFYSRELRAKAFCFLLVLFLPIFAYLFYWSLDASFSRVFEMVFSRHLYIVFQDIYGSLGHYWFQTLSRNPFFYLLALVSLYLLLNKSRNNQLRDYEIILLFYGSCMVFLCALHKQSWPYFFVLLIPSLFVLNIYTVEIFAKKRVFYVSLIAFGVFYPLLRVPHLLKRDNGFQREMLRVSAEILEKDERYFAGFDYLLDNKQSLHKFSWLDRARLLEIHSFSPLKHKEVLAKFEKNPAKFILTNYRISSLPRVYKEQFFKSYVHFYGNIHTYAPLIKKGQGSFRLAYSGKYRVTQVDQGADYSSIMLGGVSYGLGDVLELKKGIHRADLSHRTRLVLQFEEEKLQLREEFRNPAKFFDNVYEY